MEQAIKFMQGAFKNFKAHKTLAQMGQPSLTVAGNRTSNPTGMAGISASPVMAVTIPPALTVLPSREHLQDQPQEEREPGCEV